MLIPRRDGMFPMHYLLHALDMKTVRNQVREFMTHSTDEISNQAQMRWYRNDYKPAHAKGEMFGFVYYKQKRPIGYGLVTWRHNKFWLSGGIIPEEQGNGYGRALFQFMVDWKVSGDLWLDVWASNTKAIRLYKSLGFVVDNRSEELVVMKHEGIA